MVTSDTIVTMLANLFLIITIVLQIICMAVKDDKKKFVVRRVLLVAQLVLLPLLILRLAIGTAFQI